MRHFLTISILLYSVVLYASDYLVDTLSITSEILKENRSILVFKPIGFPKTDSVSMIYLLDGEFAKYRFDQISKEKFDRAFIGIGIININRNRDLLSAKQANRFLEFIERELIPKIEAEYLVDNRVLYGHSFGGGFTIYSLINKPGLFDKYIASSPTPIMNMIDPSIYLQLDNELKKSIKFYFSYGSQDMNQVIKWGDKLNNNLSGLKLRNIDWDNGIFEGENHSSSDIISLKKGLRY